MKTISARTDELKTEISMNDFMKTTCLYVSHLHFRCYEWSFIVIYMKEIKRNLWFIVCIWTIKRIFSYCLRTKVHFCWNTWRLLHKYFFFFREIYCDVSEIGNGPTNLTRVKETERIRKKPPCKEFLSFMHCLCKKMYLNVGLGFTMNFRIINYCRF